MTAADKKMWSDYDKAQKSETPKSALEAWARKYDAKLVGKNKVVITKSYKGDGPAPRPGTAAAPTECSDHCLDSFEGSGRIGGVGEYRIACELDRCEYRVESKIWVCIYTCTVGIIPSKLPF
jgi:hypothetical protein